MYIKQVRIDIHFFCGDIFALFYDMSRNQSRIIGHVKRVHFVCLCLKCYRYCHNDFIESIENAKSVYFINISLDFLFNRTFDPHETKIKWPFSIVLALSCLPFAGRQIAFENVFKAWSMLSTLLVQNTGREFLCYGT